MTKTRVNHFACLIMLTASTTTAFAQARPQHLTEQPSAQQTGVRPSEMGSYHNVRYSYSVEYPKRLLVPQGEPDNHDGQRFEAKDGTFKMTVWGHFNVFFLHGGNEEKLASECQEEQKEPALVVSYRFAKGSVCAFSGVKDSTIIYQKIIFLDDTFKTLRLEYPAKQKQLLDPVVNQIIKSFP